MSRQASVSTSRTSLSASSAALEHGLPLRQLLWFRSCKMRCSVVCCCHCLRLARPAAAFTLLLSMLSLAYLAGLSSRSACSEIVSTQDGFAPHALALHIPGRLNGVQDDGMANNTDMLLAARAAPLESRQIGLVETAQNRLSVPTVLLDAMTAEPTTAQAECNDSPKTVESNVTRNSSQSRCDAAAPARWQVDYAARAGVRCDLLVDGEPNELLKAEAFLNKSRGERSCSASDELLASASCDDLRAAGYGKPPNAMGRHPLPDNDSSAFRLAFGIRLHRCAVQAELLLRSIYEPQHLYCLHVDAKAGAVVLAAVTLLAACLPNVLLAPPDNDFLYGSVSQLHADLRCMQFLLDRDTVDRSWHGAGSYGGGAVSNKWQYFLNVAGQELPLRSNDELVALLRAYNGSNDVASQFNPNIRWRYASKLYCKLANGTTVRCSRSDSVPKDAPPDNVTVYKGVSYGFFSRALVEYALRPGGFGTRLYDWIVDTWAPDEQYFATLVRQPDAPGGYREYGRTTHPTARAVKWSGYRYDSCHGVVVRGVCVLGVGDLPWLTKQSEAFANKFDYERDPLAAQCLVQYTRNSSRPRKSIFT